MYDIILLDLDGTLTDPGVGITNSVKYALEKWDIKVEDRSELYKFIGPPLVDSFKKYYGFSDEESLKALKYYREYFSVKGLFENEKYEGIDAFLENLKKNGKSIVLATAKPEKYAVQILKHFGIYEYFDFIAAATMDETRNKKADVIEYAIKSFGIKDISKAIMVGDREDDILGAKKFGMDSLGVLYGYGSREELETAGATYVAENPADVEKRCVLF